MLPILPRSSSIRCALMVLGSLSRVSVCLVIAGPPKKGSAAIRLVSNEAVRVDY